MLGLRVRARDALILIVIPESRSDIRDRFALQAVVLAGKRRKPFPGSSAIKAALAPE
jgi:hypothetical protein